MRPTLTVHPPTPTPALDFGLAPGDRGLLKAIRHFPGALYHRGVYTPGYERYKGYVSALMPDIDNTAFAVTCAFLTAPRL
jgi:hypothetical protein